MLKSILRSTTLTAAAVIGLTSFTPTPALAEGEVCIPSCTGSCGRSRPCEYRAKELSLTTTPLPAPQGDEPVQMIDPPPVETPQPQIQEQPIPRVRPGRNRRGRG